MEDKKTSALKIENLLHELSNYLEELFQDNLVKIILYGSYARNEAENESDIDIIVLTKLDLAMINKYAEKIDSIATNLSLKYDVVISILVKNSISYYKYSEVHPFYQNILKEGIEIYGRT